MMYSLLIFLLSFCVLHAQENDLVTEKLPKQSFEVHVLLEKIEPAGPLWTIHCAGGFVLCDPKDATNTEVIEDATLTFENTRQHILCNKKRLTRRALKIRPAEGELSVNGIPYCGTLLIIKQDDACYLINNVDLEQYVCGVLLGESWPGWPIEVNRAFAIMQRSYVVAHVLKARKKNKNNKTYLYDVGCTNQFQTYKGSHTYGTLHQAVADTAGIILAYEKEPIIAMYDTCCGALIPAKMKELKKASLPYLLREYPCNYCKGTKVFNWTMTYPHTEFEELLHKTVQNKRLKNISKVKISQRDDAGIVHEVKFLCGKNWISVTGKQLYNAFKDTKSFCYELEKTAEAFIFKGVGYGHHRGVCQWGARQMVKEGFSYKDILRFYYPGAYFMRLEFI